MITDRIKKEFLPEKTREGFPKNFLITITYWKLDAQILGELMEIPFPGVTFGVNWFFVAKEGNEPLKKKRPPGQEAFNPEDI